MGSGNAHVMIIPSDKDALELSGLSTGALKDLVWHLADRFCELRHGGEKGNQFEIMQEVRASYAKVLEVRREALPRWAKEQARG